ncbi:hypothetical protein ANN_20238 [Periplaneta americana]|uniref:Uncharacterized protein n=1 Tax=Periplaneta americana TaxID=6978 RepID=A0ABQ8SC34_PERAM|nr:hypothetical protein ANN_20238 [Periplaneta americana]
MGNACYYSVEKLLSSSLLSKNLKVRIYKTVILPVVLYGCETWTLTLREEQILRVFENKVLRKIFGVKRDEVTGEWRKLHNAELHALYPSPDIIRNIKCRRLRWAGHVARMDESINAYSVLVGRPEGKIPLGRSRRRWEDMGYDGYDGWIKFENETQDRQEWRNAICEREGKDSGFSYDLLDGARTTCHTKGQGIRRTGKKRIRKRIISGTDIIRKLLRWAGHVARMGESRNAYRVLVGRPEGKRRRWEDDIKMDLGDVGYDDRDWINLAQDRDQWRAYVRAANEPSGSLKAS